MTFYDENDNGIKGPGEFGIHQRRNVGRARIYGFEIGGRFNISALLTGRMQAAWTRGDNLTDGEYMSRIPPLIGLTGLRLQANQQWWIEGFARWAATQRHLSQRDKDDSRIDPEGTAGWVTYNFRTRIVLNPVRIDLLFENLADEDYKEHGSGVHSPGRCIALTISYSAM